MPPRYITTGQRRSGSIPRIPQISQDIEQPEVTAIDTLGAAVPAGVSSVKFYNTIQNKKLADSQLLQNKNFRFSTGEIDELSGGAIYDDIFIPKTDQGFFEGFTNKWSNRLQINPEYFKHGHGDAPAYTSMDEMDKINPDWTMADWNEKNKAYTEWDDERQSNIEKRYKELETTLKERNISDEDINNILYGDIGEAPDAPGRPSIVPESDPEFWDEDIIMDNIDVPDLGSFSEQEYEDWKAPPSPAAALPEDWDTSKFSEDIDFRSGSTTMEDYLKDPRSKGTKYNPLTMEESGSTTHPFGVDMSLEETGEWFKDASGMSGNTAAHRRKVLEEGYELGRKETKYEKNRIALNKDIENEILSLGDGDYGKALYGKTSYDFSISTKCNKN